MGVNRVKVLKMCRDSPLLTSVLWCIYRAEIINSLLADVIKQRFVVIFMQLLFRGVTLEGKGVVNVSKCSIYNEKTDTRF